MASAVGRARVDVGVITYNTRDLTLRALRSLLESEQDVDLRVLVHDNDSADGTAAALATELPGVDVVACPDNLGFAAGINRLLARSTAPWFFALNSDAWPEPGAIGALVETAERFPTAAAVAPLLLRPDGTLEHSTFPFPSVTVAAICAVGGYQRWLGRRADELMLVGSWHHDRPRPVDWAVGAALLMRRSIVDCVGGWDERFFMYAEDLEWCWRASRMGFEIRFDPSAVVRHIGGASSPPGASSPDMQNAYRTYRRVRGPVSTAAYRALNVVGCARQLAVGEIRGDQAQVAYWRTRLKANLVTSIRR
ncbi:MAG: glycosyltransferase family 2 protein [Acidimicrobiales bacterium]